MKSKRQEKILELIKQKVCLTQEDLQNGLMELGFNVTQSTVSRDIRELKLVKGRDDKGNYRYLVNEVVAADSGNHYKQLFTRSVKSIAYSLNNVVIKCDSGMASSVCVAVDEMFGDMMLGSLAGDDTIIIVTATAQDSVILNERLNKLI
ncbi:MAG: ArgR family transcriptional regulator [Clostridia bacterium]|nr:ArgR family transcriptional regulator [Clostridia bacterium]MEE1054606.1 ArgR family transcriptional regulator [Acutalibacteraceae bacterium]